MTKREISAIASDLKTAIGLCREHADDIAIALTEAFAKGRQAGLEETFHLLDLARKECVEAFSRGLEEAAEVAEEFAVHGQLRSEITEKIAAAIRALKDKER